MEPFRVSSERRVADPSVSTMPDGMTEEQVAELKEAFDLFDADKSGQIDFRELRAAFKALGFQVPKDELRKMFDDVKLKP